MAKSLPCETNKQQTPPYNSQKNNKTNKQTDRQTVARILINHTLLQNTKNEYFYEFNTNDSVI